MIMLTHTYLGVSGFCLLASGQKVIILWPGLEHTAPSRAYLLHRKSELPMISVSEKRHPRAQETFTCFILNR